MDFRIAIAAVASTVAAILFVYGTLQVSISQDVASAMLAKDDSQLRYQTFLDNFPSDITAITSIDGIGCSPDGWELIMDLNRQLRSLKTVYKTISLASQNAKYVSGNSSEISFDKFRDVEFTSPGERCTVAYSFSPFQDKLISKSHSIVIIAVATRSASPDEFSKDIRTAVFPYKEKAIQLGGSVSVTGDPIMSNAIAQTMTDDLAYVIGLLALMIIISGTVTRSVHVCIAVLATTFLAITGSFGAMGFLGIAITPGSALAVFIVIPLSTAFVIHAFGYRTRSPEKIIPPEGIAPLLVAGFTTAFLFGLTGITPSPDVRSLALVGSTGILVSTIAVFTTALPILFCSQKEPKLPKFAVPRWMYLRTPIAFSFLLLMVVLITVGLANIKFEYNAINYLPYDHPSRIEYERVGTNFGRMTIPLVIQTDDINSPGTWRSIKRVTDSITAEYGTSIQVAWLYDSIQELTEQLTGHTQTFPDTSPFLDQVLLLFESEDVESFVSSESGLIALSLNVGFNSSTDYFQLKEFISQHLARENLQGTLTGRVSGFFETGHRVGLDNLISLGIGAMSVFTLLIFVFRSLILAAIVLITNVIPAMTSVAILSLAGVSIDLGSSVVTAMAFGIIIDDSTHLVIRIRQLQRSGYDPLTAVVQALGDLSAPIVITSLTLSIGFCALFFAELVPFHDFAMTMLIALSSALISDLIILPSLVRKFVPDPLAK